MCDGRVATIVLEPGESTEGTAGDDVIVAEGSPSSAGGEGDDAICFSADPVATRPTADPGVTAARRRSGPAVRRTSPVRALDFRPST